MKLLALLVGATASIGVPLFVILAGLTMLGYATAETAISTLIIEMSGVTGAPALVAIPLFTFAGYIMAEAETPQRLIRLTRAAVGWVPGGVAIVSVLACAVFTAFTGASGITIIALGGLLFPILTREGFEERFSLGLLTAGGSLGLLFAPSLPVILYAIVAGVDPDRLYGAALVPGLVLVLFMSLYAAVVAHRTPGVHRVPWRWRELRDAFVGAIWELPLPVLVLFGIYGRWLTVHEAAVLTVLSAVTVNCFVYNDLSFTRDLPRIATRSAVLIGALLLILGTALGLTNYMILEEIPDVVLSAIQTHVDSRIAFLISLNLFLLVVGALLDIFSAIVVVVPLVLPIAHAYGVDPIHLGVIFLANLEIGYMTPPVGLNLFLGAFRFKRPLPELYGASLPFIAVLLAALLVITYIPALSMWASGPR